MIGHYLRTLPDDALDRILTRTMRPGAYGVHDFGGPCLVGTACDSATLRGYDARLYDDEGARKWWENKRWARMPRHNQHVEDQYDGLCTRFGVTRTNAAIRDRALRVLASRQPAPHPETVTC